jgi:hypothetical protein
MKTGFFLIGRSDADGDITELMEAVKDSCLILPFH